jgi:hypothetical protein
VAGQAPDEDRPSGPSEEPQTQPARGVVDRIDLADTIRIAGGLGASAWMRSPWLFLGAIAYNIIGGPLRDFLQDVAKKAGPAAGDMVVEWIWSRRRRGSIPPHGWRR